MLDQPRNNVVIENQKAKCKVQEVVGGEDEAQRPRAESSWGHLGMGDVRPRGASPTRAELGDPALGRSVHAQPLRTGTGRRLFPDTCRIYTALIFHPAKNCTSPGKAAFPRDFPRNPAHPRGLQSTQQAPGCVGSDKSRSTRGISHGK